MGNVTIGTTTPQATLLYVNGDIVVNGLIVGQGASITVPNSNTILGLAALGNGNASVSTAFSVAVGYHALSSISSAYTGNNTAVGYNSMGAIVGVAASSSSNTALGRDSLGQATSGARNTAIGSGTIGGVLTGGSDNTAVGYSALTMAAGMSADNTAVGRNTLGSLTGGNNNTALGYNSLGANTTGAGNVGVGTYAGHYELGSSTLYIDDQDRGNSAGDKVGALLYGTFNSTPSLQTLTINGKVGIGSTTPVANLQVNNPTANSTTTMEVGNAQSNKGSCLKLYRTDGTPVYAYVAAGATTFTLSTSACATVTGF
jgi:hypothetical protein